MKNGIVALVALAGLASGSYATTAWLVDITYSNPSGRIEKAGDTATVEISAQFDDGLHAFAGALFDVNTGDNNGSWSNLGLDLAGPGTFEGAPVNGDVTGVLAGQLDFHLAGIFADTSNPIKAWHGTFTTSDFSPRTDNLSTKTAKYDVYTKDDGTSSSFLGSLIEGAGGIEIGVIPAPGTAALLGLGALAAGRRRR